MKVSVVVPVFNAEKYIKTCLDSILRQTYRDFEMIVVDDGSTDCSGEICDKFAEQCENVRVLHKKNEGVSCARRDGLQMAEGDYIVFVDADDWIDEDFLELGVCCLEKEAADMVITGCIIEDNNGTHMVKNKIMSGIYNREDMERKIFPDMLYYGEFYEFGIMPYFWNKFYKKQLIVSCHTCLDTDIYDGEDAAVVYPCLLKAEKIVILDDAGYHYRIHSESVTAGKRSDYYENVAKLYLYLAKQFKASGFQQCLMPQLDQYMRMMIWQGNPAGFIESTKVIFPFKEVPCGASVILYGAGYAGRIFHYQLIQSGYCSIAAWVDKAYQREELRQMGVVGMEALHTVAYDFVVLAVRDKDMAAEITDQLVSYGVGREKIIFYAQ